MIVVDTNVIAYLHIPGEFSDQAVRALRRDPMWAAPYLWISELRNILATYVRKELVVERVALRVMAEAETLMEGRSHAVSSDLVLRLAANSGCSAYDAEFVALALTLGAPLVTADRKLASTFPETCIALADFAAS